MSKKSFIVGLMFSVVVHCIFLLPGDKAANSKEVEPEVKKVAKFILPPPQPAPKPVPKEEPKLQPQKRHSEPKIESLKEVVKPNQTIVAEEAGDFSDSESDDSLPELRLIWDNPQQLIQVAKANGMRILIVNRSNEPVGELILEEGISVKSFEGKLTNFSNRVRTISAQFFGTELLRQSDESIKCFWVVIPASIDQAWVSVQRQAIRSKGVKSSQVSYIEARVAPNGSSYELVVTRVVML